MTVFIISPKGEITQEADKAAALALTMGDKSWLIVAEARDLPFPGTDRLAKIYADAQPDEAVRGDKYDRDDVFAAMVAKFNPTSAAAPSATSGQPQDWRGTTMSEPQTADTANAPAPAAPAPKSTKAKGKSAAKTTKAAAPAKPVKAKAAPKRSTGKPAGAVADFGQVLKGSKRANILELMDGKLNAEGIGKKLGIPASLVSSNVFCLNRDIGVGYSYGDGNVITAIFPKGKTLADALRVKAEPKPKAAKAPKAAAAPKAKATKPAAKKAGAKAK